MKLLIGSIEEKSPFVYTSVFWVGFDETSVIDISYRIAGHGMVENYRQKKKGEKPKYTNQNKLGSQNMI